MVRLTSCKAAIALLILAAHAAGAPPKDRAEAVPAPQAGPGLESAFAVLAGSKVSDGRLYAPFYDYYIWPHAVVAKQKAYCTFQNGTGQPIVMVYDPGGKRWSEPAKVSEFGLKGDDHLVFLVRIPEREFSVQTVEQSIELLDRLHGSVA